MSARERGMGSRTPSHQSAYEQLLAELERELNGLETVGLRRRVTRLEAIHGPLVEVDGRTLVSWSSNDYLGLSTHPRLVAAATHAAAQWGVGARASRLLAGTTSWHVQLEESLASWFGAQDALVYASGYMANAGTLGALLSPGDAVFVDRLAHASLIDAARASRASLSVFRHNDVAQLERLLARATGSRRRLVVTEGVFSMDGDVCPLKDLTETAERHGAIVYLDDAHGAFVLGQTGRGTPEASHVSHDRLVYMGTLGKALGCQGGFVIGPSRLIDLLRNRARTFMYATAPAVPVVAAAVEALRVLQDEPNRREDLCNRVARLQEYVAPLRGVRGGLGSPIIPIVVGETSRALAVSTQLLGAGQWAPAIRPPTVPKGTARIRVSVSALHTMAQVDALGRALMEALGSA